MAYNREMLLRKIIEIQNIVLKGQKKSLSQKEMYHNVIAPKYFISIATFYKYLGCNAKKELAEIEERRRLKEVADREREKVVLNEV
ncbi:hypothetical protein D0T84_21515 [Dysgonomonas sp. 521]|uniref:hypothetical protein n=1 Tax=Dysgonomonas sp. 521 TaxID=2302932 RepID=UPI0013D896DF|nr:hypothetical protein [Dysgonomonas sp. 521]NDV97451.1 hypothetical protein [Dysgonomonas sp. 521]